VADVSSLDPSREIRLREADLRNQEKIVEQLMQLNETLAMLLDEFTLYSKEMRNG
jgi:hypothetical protein